jgi:hypothetical protein
MLNSAQLKAKTGAELGNIKEGKHLAGGKRLLIICDF